MTGPRLVVARRELRAALRERTILLAVVIQIFVAGFSGFLVIGLSALLDPDSQPVAISPRVAVVGSGPLLERLTAAGLTPLAYEDEATARAAFEAGAADAVLIERGAGDPARPVTIDLVLPDGDFAATFTLVKVKVALEDHEAALRESREDRIAARPPAYEAPAPAGSYAFVYSLLVPMLLLLPVVLAGALVADSLTEEIQRGTLPLLLSTRATAVEIVDGKILGSVVLVPILSLAWLGLLALNGLGVSPVGAALLLLLATALAIAFALLACFIALALRDRNRAQVVYASAFFVLLEVSLALPVSPVNAMAQIAAGSTGEGALVVVGAGVGLAAGGWLALRAWLKRNEGRLAAGA